MIWDSRTKPTPANIRLRIQAAVEAMEGAEALLRKREGDAPSIRRDTKALKELGHAKAWAKSASRILGAKS